MDMSGDLGKSSVGKVMGPKSVFSGRETGGITIDSNLRMLC